MGLIGFRCPVGSVTAGTEIDFISCLKCQTPCLPVMIRAGIIKSHQYRGESISATTITGCLRQTFLSRKVDYYANPQTLTYSAFRGSVIHTILENIAQSSFQGGNVKVDLAIDEVLNDFITEKRIYKEFPLTAKKLVKVSGQIDIYQKSTNTLHDYKTMADNGIYFLSKGQLKEEHIIQTNFYRWLLTGILPVDKIKIHYITMGKVLTTGTHCEFIDRGKDKSFDLPDVPLVPEKEFLSLVRPKIIEMVEAFEEGVPPSADGGDAGWRCKFCEFTDGCDWYEQNVRSKIPKINGNGIKEVPEVVEVI